MRKPPGHLLLVRVPNTQGRVVIRLANQSGDLKRGISFLKCVCEAGVSAIRPKGAGYSEKRKILESTFQEVLRGETTEGFLVIANVR